MDTTRASLLLRLRNRGDADAWQQFDRLYRPMLYRFARASGLDASEADEVTQACVVAVLEHISRFDYDPSRGRFKAWLRTLVSNRIRDQHRKRRPGQADTFQFEGTPDTAESPETAFDRVWRERHLQYCLEEIRQEVEPATMQAFELYVLQERPVEELCDRLKTTPQQLYRVRWRIMRKVEEKMKLLMMDEN